MSKPSVEGLFQSANRLPQDKTEDLIAQVLNSTPQNMGILIDAEKVRDLTADRALRIHFAKVVLWGLVMPEVFLAFAFVGLVSFKLVTLDSKWLLPLVFDSVIVQSFASLTIVLKYLFNKK